MRAESQAITVSDLPAYGFAGGRALTNPDTRRSRRASGSTANLQREFPGITGLQHTNLFPEAQLHGPRGVLAGAHLEPVARNLDFEPVLAKPETQEEANEIV